MRIEEPWGEPELGRKKGGTFEKEERFAVQAVSDVGKFMSPFS